MDAQIIEQHILGTLDDSVADLETTEYLELLKGLRYEINNRIEITENELKQ